MKRQNVYDKDRRGTKCEARGWSVGERHVESIGETEKWVHIQVGHRQEREKGEGVLVSSVLLSLIQLFYSFYYCSLPSTGFGPDDKCFIQYPSKIHFKVCTYVVNLSFHSYPIWYLTNQLCQLAKYGLFLGNPC